MRYTIIQLETFVSRWRDLKLRDEDLIALEEQLSQNPEAGAIIPGTGGVRKLRFAPPSSGRGKRGATRVCYAYFPVGSRIYLFTIYAKNVQENLTAKEKQVLWRIMSALKGKS